MRNHRFMNIVISCATAALAFAATAHAQNNRTFVATNGSDTNNCGPTTPCRTFAAALAVTNPGGELVVLTSGGYGPVAISQPVTITAIGVDASITQAASDENALTINTTGNVTINGLSLYGGGTGNDGIVVQQVGFLRLSNVTVNGFAGTGAFVFGKVAIYDSHFNDNGVDGVMIASGDAYVHNSGFDHNAGDGMLAAAAVVVADSYAHNNEIGFHVVGGAVSLIRDDVVLNSYGVFAENAGTTVQLSYCLVAQNATDAYYIGGSGINFSGSSPGSNAITGNSSGTPSAATTLQ